MTGRGWRWAVWRRLWSFGTWWASRRTRAAREEDVQRHVYRTQTRGMGLRLSGWARDRLRRRWLKLRPRDAESSGD